MRGLFAQSDVELCLFSGAAGERRRDGRLLGVLAIDGLLPFVEFALPATERLALPALIGLRSLMGLGLLAVGPSERGLPLFNLALATAKFRLSGGKFLLALAKPKPCIAGAVFVFGELSVEVGLAAIDSLLLRAQMAGDLFGLEL